MASAHLRVVGVVQVSVALERDEHGARESLRVTADASDALDEGVESADLLCRCRLVSGVGICIGIGICWSLLRLVSVL